jgi:hypothetical protein
MFFFPLDDSLVSVLQVYANVSEHSSILIGGLSRKNNWGETVAVLIPEKVWLKNSLSQSGERGDGEGVSPSTETSCEGHRPQVEASSM